jgi:hypothetical protein
MLSYTDMSGIIDSTDFGAQITGAVTIVALAIQEENTETPNHANRIAWAKSALSSPASVASSMRAAVIGMYADILPSAGGTLTDQQIKTAIEASVNTFATGG